MQLSTKTLAGLALLAGLLVVAASQTKVSKCCTEVSTSNITAQITGYRIQKKNLPCVSAVIFQTTEGEVCSHWKENWVRQTVSELNRLRKSNRTTAAPNTTSQ